MSMTMTMGAATMDKGAGRAAARWPRGMLTAALWALAAMILMQVSTCSPAGDVFGSRGGTVATGIENPQTVQIPSNLPPAAGEVLGTGPVRVALLLPLTGDEGLANVGTSMANAARLAMQAIEGDTRIPANIQLTIKDTQGSSTRARQAASEAIAEGSQLILGPLLAESVRAAGATARTQGVPLIGFSNQSGVASDGVYLLNILPETEARRSLDYARSLGRSNIVALVSNSTVGDVQMAALQAATAATGTPIQGVYRFSENSLSEFQDQANLIIPIIQSGQVDTLFLPERRFAPNIALLLENAGVDKNAITIIGSSDWDGDSKIQSTPYLAGAFYPSVDPTGYERMAAQYEPVFGAKPHPLSTFAYTAVLLANSDALAKASPPFSRSALTRSNGFDGRDGVFRFLSNGTNTHALVMKQAELGGSRVVDPAKMP